MFKKIIGIFITAILLLSVVGCGTDSPLPTSTETPSPKPQGVFANLDDTYVLLSEAVIPSTLPPVVNEGEGPSFVQGEGVLFGDKVSSISITLNDMEGTIIVDGVSAEFFDECFLGANIVDLDQSDNYHELALYSDGASADPSVSFYRYDGVNLRPIENHYVYEDFDYYSSSLYCYFHGEKTDILPTYGPIWTNRKGSVITSFQQMAFTDSRIALARFVLRNGAWKEESIKTDMVLGTHKVSEDFSAFFTPQDTAPEDYGDFMYMGGYVPGGMRDFKKGETIEILGYGRLHDYYTFYVQTEGGKGVVAFWLGD